MYSSISTALVILASLLPVLASLAIVLRLKARRGTKAGYGADDYIILAALVGSNTMSSVLLWGTTRLRQTIQIVLYGLTAFTIYGSIVGGNGDSERNIFTHPREAAIFFKVLSRFLFMGESYQWWFLLCWLREQVYLGWTIACDDDSDHDQNIDAGSLSAYLHYAQIPSGLQHIDWIYFWLVSGFYFCGCQWHSHSVRFDRWCSLVYKGASLLIKTRISRLDRPRA